jgi:hypothetical protein
MTVKGADLSTIVVGLEYANKDHMDRFQDDIIRIPITADNVQMTVFGNASIVGGAL